MGLLKSIGSSIIMESFIQAVCDSAEGSKAPEFMNVGETMGDSCLTGGKTVCDCRGKGLFMGGVGGALCRTKGSLLLKANERVVGVLSYEEFVDVWP
jgi:hypothetical protein